jgi:hypothetical protein
MHNIVVLQVANTYSFSLFFGTFDAIVLMASIYILFPKEHPELLQNAMQHFQWSVERFEVMSERNGLAKAALSVLQAIYIRLKKSLGMGFVCAKSPMNMTETPGSAADSFATSNIDPSLTNASVNGNVGPSSNYTPGASSVSASSNGDAYNSIPASAVAAVDGSLQSPEFTLPPDFDWSAIQPIYATGDLAYNDLMGIGNDRTIATWAADAPEAPVQLPWQFEGDFTDNSVWNLLNQFSAT